MGRQEIRAREADGSSASASATPSVRLLSLRPLHNIVELATVLVPEPGQRTSVRAVIDRWSRESSLTTRRSHPCSPRDRTFHVPKRKAVRKSRDGPVLSSCVSSRDFLVRDFVA